MEELIDILDKDGRPTGEIKTKKEVHELGLWHKTVHIWLVNSKGEILLQKRSLKVSNHPGEWDISAAGHISAGEISIISALREVEEEIGLNLDASELELIGDVSQQSITRNGTYFNNEYNDVYLVRKDIPLEQMKRQESEVDELKWISITEFKDWAKSAKPELVQHPAEFDLLNKFI